MVNIGMQKSREAAKNVLIVNNASRTFHTEPRAPYPDGFIRGPSRRDGCFSFDYIDREAVLDAVTLYTGRKFLAEIICWKTTYEDKYTGAETCTRYEYEIILVEPDRRSGTLQDEVHALLTKSGESGISSEQAAELMRKGELVDIVKSDGKPTHALRGTQTQSVIQSPPLVIE